MYILYTDQSEIFEATIGISGAPLHEAKCRLILETPHFSMLIPGQIEADGTTKIAIRALSKYFPEGQTGTLTLEVIADTTYCVPWTSPFEVRTNRKITAEVKTPSSPVIQVMSKPQITTNIKSKNSVLSEDVGKMIVKYYGGNYSPDKRLGGLIEEMRTYFKSHNISAEQTDAILTDAIHSLTHKNR